MPDPSNRRLALPTEAGPALAVAHGLAAAGHAAYLVGGAVRDLLLGLAPGDFDVATSATPETVRRLHPDAMLVGASFGVLLVPYDGGWVETATFRREGPYSDGRRPDEVVYTESLAEDAARRDFTVNALYLDPETGALLDPCGGLPDIASRILRAVGEPGDRFTEDGLRLLRAVRIAAACGLTIAPDTRAALGACAERIDNVSPERVGDELTRILTGPSAGDACQILLETELFARLLPEVAALDGVEQSPDHHPEGDVWTHVRGLLDLLSAPTPSLAWAALLHDVGKPLAMRRGERIRFPGHARIGAQLARTILLRLRRSRALTDRVCWLIDEHMKFTDLRAMRESTRRRFLRQDGFDELLALHRLDRLAANRDLETWSYGRELLETLGAAGLTPPPLLDGNDLRAAGIAAGPRIGTLLRELETRQLEGEITSREAALDWLRRQH